MDDKLPNILRSEIEVTVVIPLYNEERFIEKCIISLLNQDFKQSKIEFILVDGGSTDKSTEIIKEFRDKHPGLIKVFYNPNKTVPYAMNIGIKAASGKYIIRLDAHCEYPLDYISKCLYYLNTTNADNVGGRAITKGTGYVGNAIAMMLSSTFGVGNSRFRTNKSSGYVDTVPFGAFRRDVFVKYGLYDERLTRNQDNELNFRIRKNGGKIYLAEEITFTYYCRSSIKSLIDMAMSNGRWNIITMRICPGAMSIRHFIPFVFLLSLAILTLLSALSPVFKWILLAEIAIYAFLSLVFSITAVKHIKYIPVLLILFPLFHISYGWGSALAFMESLRNNYNRDR